MARIGQSSDGNSECVARSTARRVDDGEEREFKLKNCIVWSKGIESVKYCV
jgi:hypothetical protein